jgi:hypothetical protein
MAERRTGGSRLADGGVLTVAVVAVVCCAGLPAISAAIGGLTLAALLGAGAGLLATVALLSTTLILIGARRGSGSRGRR